MNWEFMFDVIQFILCSVGFIGSLAAIPFIVIVFNGLRPYNVLKILFLTLAVITLCVIAAVCVALAMVDVLLV